MGDDYMSENFINTIQEVCPGLLNKHEKRQNEMLKRKQELDYKNRTVSKKELEEANRDKHLSTPLSSDNVGFRLLSKMGYQPSEGIGKINKRNFEPIRVDVKKGRIGLGAPPIPKKIRPLINPANVAPKVKIGQEAVESYRASARDKVVLQRISKNLEKAKKLMLTLDEEAGIVEEADVREPDQDDDIGADDSRIPLLPPCPEPDDDNYFKTCRDMALTETHAKNLESMESELLHICHYLRDTYNYCIWCGTKYESEEDMGENCPGLTEDEH